MRLLFLGGPAAAAALAGTADGTSAAAGTLAAQAPLGGDAAGTSTATGTLAAGAPLGGPAAGTSTATGTLAPAILPADLAAALEARFVEAQSNTLAGLTRLYESQAGERPVPPYAVYQITRGTLCFTSDTLKVYDQAVTITVYAAEQGQANALRDRVHSAIGPTTGSYAMAKGDCWPFFETNRREGKEPGRGSGGKYTFKSVIEYSARTERTT